eukprot:SAG31_NODE_22160_length_532_cov_1.108545_1_plen_75_part_01
MAASPAAGNGGHHEEPEWFGLAVVEHLSANGRVWISRWRVEVRRCAVFERALLERIGAVKRLIKCRVVTILTASL